MEREDLLKVVNFDRPERVPVIFHINLSCWDSYPREELSELVLNHPLLFPEGVPEFIVQAREVPYPDWCTAGKPWTDPWGCLWETSVSGYIGTVTSHPLEDWAALDGFKPPDPDKTTHWYPVTWEKGRIPHGGSIGFFGCLRSGEIGHGHTFLKLIDLLGYEKTLFSLHDGDSGVKKILGLLEGFNYGLVTRFLDYAQVEWLGYAEDLGMQIGPMLSPELFERYILPSYRNIMKPAKEQGAVIHMHSDGDIRTLAPCLLDLPINVLNLQDRVNGLDWIREHIKGKLAIDLDIDRQFITPSGSPEDVRNYIVEIMNRLYDPAGGLILTFGLYPGTPMENIRALMDILEEIADGRVSWSS